MSDHFPSALQLSYAIWPYDRGEVLVQAYNTLLTVRSLLDTCEGVILTRNEDLHATCKVRPPHRMYSSVRLAPPCSCAFRVSKEVLQHWYLTDSCSGQCWSYSSMLSG